jgi:outer membrane receptor protein involved in Fe transport
VSVTTDVFVIDRSAEQVYLADDGTAEFQGPSRAWGGEAKIGIEFNQYVSLFGGMTKVSNVFFRATSAREYVTNAPRMTANAGITLSAWHGWSGSMRMRSISHYALDSLDTSITAAGHTVWDLGIARRLRRGVEVNVTVDNVANRSYWETQNYYGSRLPGQAPLRRIHATPGYPLTVMAGLTFRFYGK